MADIPNRREREAALSSSLSNVFAAHRESAKRGPDSVNWRQLEADANEKLSTEILAVYLLMLGMMSSKYDVSLVGAEASAASYAQARAANVASTMTANMQAELAAARAAQASAASYAQAVERIFSEARAEMIAATETTAAASAAEQAAAEEIEQLKGVGLEATWRTEQDASVCPICAPLDGQPSEAWEDQFPGGPPAHPNCRCWLDWDEE